MSEAAKTSDTDAAPVKVAVKNLEFFYGESRALKGINLSLYANKVTAFIGPSGCGKSTLSASSIGCTISILANGPRARCCSTGGTYWIPIKI